MLGLDRTRLVSALTYLFMALFVTSGIVSFRYRRSMRGAAIFLYLALLVGVLAWIALWAAGYSP
jgi:hypothetical protein